MTDHSPRSGETELRIVEEDRCDEHVEASFPAQEHNGKRKLSLDFEVV